MEIIVGFIILLVVMCIFISVIVGIARIRRAKRRYRMDMRRGKWRYK